MFEKLVLLGKGDVSCSHSQITLSTELQKGGKKLQEILQRGPRSFTWSWAQAGTAETSPHSVLHPGVGREQRSQKLHSGASPAPHTSRKGNSVHDRCFCTKELSQERVLNPLILALPVDSAWTFIGLDIHFIVIHVNLRNVHFKIVGQELDRLPYGSYPRPTWCLKYLLQGWQVSACS